jgi:DNA-directed RNA polymerase subunit M/transcription elongation factor TFIIS
MAIHYLCPHCKKGMKSPDRFAGKRVSCPKCKTELIVPEKKVVHTRREKARLESSQGGGVKEESELGKEPEPQSEIETGDFESEAKAVRREVHEAES